MGEAKKKKKKKKKDQFGWRTKTITSPKNIRILWLDHRMWAPTREITER